MNPYIIANQFLNEIAQKRMAGRRWTWERYLPGPMSASQASRIAELAGCWVCDPGENPVRFYCNANHPRWQ